MEEIEAISLHFICYLSQEDWDSISIVEEAIEQAIEEDGNYLKLPTGRIVYLPDRLIRKEQLAQFDWIIKKMRDINGFKARNE